VSFCAHAILDDGAMEVWDARADSLFANYSTVTGPPYVRFYAGVPLKVHGAKIGTLCVIDQKPRRLDAAQRLTLLDLAAITSALVERSVPGPRDEAGD
jgi:GAF domain-containing protein